jgi:hypothetical protein
VFHNTNLVTLYSSSSTEKIVGFIFTNNLAKYNMYGLFGNGQTGGTVSLNYYTSNWVFKRNVMATDKSLTTIYPPDNQFPPVATFLANFQNIGAEDYRLVTSSVYQNAGTDGKDIGCTLPGWQ